MRLRSLFSAIALSILICSPVCAAAPATAVPPDGYIEVYANEETRSQHGVFEVCTKFDNRRCTGEWLAAEKYVRWRLKNPVAKYVGMDVSRVSETYSCGRDCVGSHSSNYVYLFYNLPSAR